MRYVILKRWITLPAHNGVVAGFGVFQRLNNTAGEKLMPGDVWVADFRRQEHAEEFITAAQ